jgi:hypothetical protein
MVWEHECHELEHERHEWEHKRREGVEGAKVREIRPFVQFVVLNFCQAIHVTQLRSALL